MTDQLTMLDEHDVLMADIGEHGEVAFLTIRGGFQAHYQGSDGIASCFVHGPTMIDCLRQLYDRVVSE